MQSDDQERSSPRKLGGYEAKSGIDLGPRYALGRKLGRGASGTVYIAKDTMLGVDVCIKILHEGLADAHDVLERFKRELLLARRITHPGMCKVYDLQCTYDGNIYFLVMELVEGETLTDILLREGALPLDRATDLVYQSADAIGAAHAEGVVHRDVKPENIMVRPDDRVVVLDFGIAMAQGLDRLTRPGFVLGSRKYMAPELWTGVIATPPSDVWSLGVILYGCCTGRLPYRTEGTFGVLDAIESSTPPRPRDLNPDISPELEAVIMHAIEVEADDRFPNAWALRDALAPFTPRANTSSSGRNVATPAPASAPVEEASSATAVIEDHFFGATIDDTSSHTDSHSLPLASAILLDPPNTLPPESRELSEPEDRFLDEKTEDVGRSYAAPESFEADATVVVNGNTQGVRTETAHSSEVAFNPFEGILTEDHITRSGPGSRSLLFEDVAVPSFELPPTSGNSNEVTAVVAGDKVDGAGEQSAVSSTEVLPRARDRARHNEEDNHEDKTALITGLVDDSVDAGAAAESGGGAETSDATREPPDDDEDVVAPGDDDIALPPNRAPLIAALAVGAVLVVGAIGIAVSGGDDPPPPVATVEPSGDDGTSPPPSDIAATDATAPDQKNSPTKVTPTSGRSATASKDPAVTTKKDPPPKDTRPPPKPVESTSKVADPKVKIEPRAAKDPKTQATAGKTEYAAAQKNLARAMSRAGLLKGDVASIDSAQAEAARLAQKKHYPEAEAALTGAIAAASKVKIDQAFVFKKLERFNRRYESVSDAKKKSTLTKLAQAIADAIGRGDYVTANRKLNEGFAVMR